MSYVLWNLWSHSLRGSTGLTSIRIFCRILLPCRWYSFAQNVISSAVDGSDYHLQILSESVQILRSRSYCIDAVDWLCAQLTRDLFAIAKFLVLLLTSVPSFGFDLMRVDSWKTRLDWRRRSSSAQCLTASRRRTSWLIIRASTPIWSSTARRTLSRASRPSKMGGYFDNKVCTAVVRQWQTPSGVTSIGQGWTNSRGLRGLGGPKPDPKFFLHILIFQVLGVSHSILLYSWLFVNVHFAFHHCFVFNGNYN